SGGGVEGYVCDSATGECCEARPGIGSGANEEHAERAPVIHPGVDHGECELHQSAPGATECGVSVHRLCRLRSALKELFELSAGNAQLPCHFEGSAHLPRNFSLTNNDRSDAARDFKK